MDFIYANLGPPVIKQLAEEANDSPDDGYLYTFAADVENLIRSHKDGWKPSDKRYPQPGDFMKGVIRPVLDAVLALTCPAPENRPRSPDIAQWALWQYLTHRHNGLPILPEDLHKVGEDIAYFEGVKKSEEFKQSGAPRDLLRYESLDALRAVLTPFRERKEQRAEETRQRRMTEAARAQLAEETTVLYKGPLGAVVIPHTPKASQHWGNNTRWCISANYGNEHFNAYNANGYILMLLPTGQSSNKVAIAQGVMYDSADRIISELPETHQTLMDACLASLSAGSRPHVKRLLSPPSFESRQRRPDYLHTTDPEKWNDRAFVMEALGRYPKLMRRVPPHLQKYRDFMRDIVLRHPQAIETVAPAVARYEHGNMGFVLECLELSDELAFYMEGKKFKHVYKVPHATLMRCQRQALERMLKKGELNKLLDYFDCTRDFWRTPDLLFGIDEAARLAIIGPKIEARYPSAPAPAQRPAAP
jgi:hypothetical protein